MIEVLGALISSAFDLGLRPLLALGAVSSLLVVSALAGLAMILVFRRFSNQAALRVAKSRTIASLMALSLYRTVPGALPGILADLAVRTVSYLRCGIQPLLVLSLPLLVLLFQLEARYTARPLRVGESAIVSVIVRDSGNLRIPGGLALQGSPGVIVETPPVRIPSQRRAVWRVRATQEGTHEVRITSGGAVFAKQVVAGRSTTILSRNRSTGHLPERLLQFGERPLDGSAGVVSVSIAYPELELEIFGLRLPWLGWFLLASAATAIALKGYLRVSL